MSSLPTVAVSLVIHSLSADPNISLCVPPLSSTATRKVTTSHSSRGPVANQHHMITKAKSGVFKPRIMLAYSEPTTVTEALLNANWREAMMEEFQALQANNTWTLVHLPPIEKPLLPLGVQG